MNPKISIIVPIFNMENYLSRSIESIQSQSLKDIEIILVNDGSIDNSLSICKEYQKKDSRIKIIDKPNGGVSSSRNAGLEVAKGDYIGFVDPDDWIDPDMYQNLYKEVKIVDADVCFCNYMVEKEGESIPNLLKIKQGILEGPEIINQIIVNMIANSSLNSNSPTIMGSVWRLIIKKELINLYNFRFEVGIPLMEDLLFCVQVLLKSKRVCIDKGVYYYYMINSNSAVTSYRDDIVEVQQKVYQILEKMLKDEKVYSIVEKRMAVRYVNMCIISIANEAHISNYKDFKEKIRFINRICKDKTLKNIILELDTKGYTLRKKLTLTAIKNEIGIFLYCYYRLLIKTLSK